MNKPYTVFVAFTAGDGRAHLWAEAVYESPLRHET